MAGVIVGFDPDEFRAAIHDGMQIGLPPKEEDQPIFHFADAVTNDLPADSEDVPFDPAARPTVTTRPPERVPCAIEYFDAAGKVVQFGVIQPSRALLTFLDVDYAKVKGFSYVLLGGDKFFYSKTPPGVGLGSVGIQQVYVVAEDDA